MGIVIVSDDKADVALNGDLIGPLRVPPVDHMHVFLQVDIASTVPLADRRTIFEMARRRSEDLTGWGPWEKSIQGRDYSKPTNRCKLLDELVLDHRGTANPDTENVVFYTIEKDDDEQPVEVCHHSYDIHGTDKLPVPGPTPARLGRFGNPVGFSFKEDGGYSKLQLLMVFRVPTIYVR
ncbi:MAG: hypothetical protein CMJ31_01360 [Phycisphaerae bacterium]|nr:hypothetical protein [Phycisphaerae bacterium]